jgi:hypothetical protein
VSVHAMLRRSKFKCSSCLMHCCTAAVWCLVAESKRCLTICCEDSHVTRVSSPWAVLHGPTRACRLHLHSVQGLLVHSAACCYMVHDVRIGHTHAGLRLSSCSPVCQHIKHTQCQRLAMDERYIVASLHAAAPAWHL